MKLDSMINDFEKFNGSKAIGATTNMTFAQLIDSARLIMFASHLNQLVTCKHVEYPRLYTNNENIVGKYSTYNKIAAYGMELICIMEKFDNISEEGHKVQPRWYFYKDTINNTIGVLSTQDVEDLTEKYGFKYNNSGIESYEVGDIIEEGSVLSRPTSFDKYGNYGFGLNVPTMWTSDVNTIEDGIEVSESLAKKFISYEVETVTVPINDNDFLINLYGDSVENYKTFPDIGEDIKDDILCASRRIIKSQILYDFKTSNSNKILGSDNIKYIKGKVVDIKIYCNKEISEIPDTLFNKQILKYLVMDRKHRTDMYEYISELFDIFGYENCSDKIKQLHKECGEFIDDTNTIKNESNSPFSNIEIKFVVRREIGLSKGQKLTGRSGNKGVISKITPDREMPWVKQADGTYKLIDIKINCLSIFNRLIAFEMYENSITFICNRVCEHFSTMNPSKDLKEMERIFFRILEIFNAEQEKKFRKIYKDNCKTKKDKIEFFDITIKEGIFIHIEPLWHKENLYESVFKCYEEFPWIQPYDVLFYEPISGRVCKQMNKGIIGDMYVMKLKQNSKKNLSVCSTAPINKRGVPEKTSDAKKHNTLVPNTPVRSGVQESLNQLISASSSSVAEEHAMYRNSPQARRATGKSELENYGEGKPVTVEITDLMTNRNVEILSAFLKIMGSELEQGTNDFYLPDGTDDNTYYTHTYNGEQYIATPLEMRRMIAKKLAKDKIDNKEYILIGDGMDIEQFIDEIADIIEYDMMDCEDFDSFKF